DHDRRKRRDQRQDDVHVTKRPDRPTLERAPARRGVAPAQAVIAFDQSANTNSMDVVEEYFSDGSFCITNGDCREPARTAMYCLPFTEFLMAGALMPVPTLNLQACCRVLAA